MHKNQNIPACNVQEFYKGDKVKITMKTYENYKEAFSWITTDKPRKVNESKNNPMLFNAIGVVVYVDSKHRANGFGRIRVKLLQPAYGIHICEFPCYKENLIVKCLEDGTEIQGLYIIEKI